jgi:hypothetical protein
LFCSLFDLFQPFYPFLSILVLCGWRRRRSRECCLGCHGDRVRGWNEIKENGRK